MGDHFDKNEKNPPGGATVANYSKQILKLILWHYRLWSFQGRDTKLERFLAKNQLYSNEITKF